jgi:hypothetical protein
MDRLTELAVVVGLLKVVWRRKRHHRLLLARESRSRRCHVWMIVIVRGHVGSMHASAGHWSIASD